MSKQVSNNLHEINNFGNSAAFQVQDQLSLKISEMAIFCPELFCEYFGSVVVAYFKSPVQYVFIYIFFVKLIIFTFSIAARINSHDLRKVT